MSAAALIGKSCVRCGAIERYSNGDCKQCAVARAKRYHQVHHDRRVTYKREWARVWRATHPHKAREQRRVRSARRTDRRREEIRRWSAANPNYHRAWRASHSESVKAAYDRWRLKYPERVRAARKEWRAANPDMVREGVRRRKMCRARVLGLSTPATRSARIAYHGGRCWICERRSATQIDHVIALVHGGTDWPANLRPACQSCNGAKGQWEGPRRRSIEEIMAWVRRRRARDFGIRWPR